MPNYRRAKFQGGYYFFTVVTYKRKKLFNDEKARNILREAFTQMKIRYDYETIALCLLPEHLHCIWKLPDGDCDFSIRWAYVKGQFSRKFRQQAVQKLPVNHSRIRKGELQIWQRRFWEHYIRDEKDLQRHVDYIHYNPMKHGLVKDVSLWPWSTYHKYVIDGMYQDDCDINIKRQSEDKINFGQ